MKSLNDNYVATHGGNQETFTDLMFCALVVLVLFVLALAVEVSQRVRATKDALVKKIEPVAVVEEKELATLTKEELAELSKKLQFQEKEIKTLKQTLSQEVNRIKSREDQVQTQLAAMNGEQRFTGAREPASLTMAYDYDEEKFYFISSRESEHADRQTSGESDLEYMIRKRREMVAIALKARNQRGFTLEEAKQIYQGFTTYKEVEPSEASYKIIDSVLGISYHKVLSGYIAGDTEMTEHQKFLVESNLLEVYQTKGLSSEEMYPRVELKIDSDNQQLTINGVLMDARSAKEILLSLGGRGALIDLTGIKAQAPKWLSEEVLIPAGYISKIPKLPGQ